ncbi:MAG TPA: hypothetical protein VFU22_29725, partial [Roseiflexaceae bacterium]|nr:hypothetical protein [Roseiflexaceae bacterium]
AALQNSVGSARIALTTPRKGRKGDEYLTYGTFQIDDETTLTITGPDIARKSRAAAAPTAKVITPKAATGATKRLRRPAPKAATGKTKKLKRNPPSGRNVVTPPDLARVGIAIKYDPTIRKYYAEGIVGPFAGHMQPPKRTKGEAIAHARLWIAVKGPQP